MIPYFQLTPEQQRDVLSETQAQSGLPALFLEKDYWVCRVLEMLFENRKLNPHLCFRGGTSLSKAFQYIQRFSEDIDLALSPAFFTDMPEELLPSSGESSSQRDRKHRKMREYYRNLMNDVISPSLQQSFASRGISGVRFEMEDLSKARDPFVLYIHYPSVLDHVVGSYVAPAVKLELSGRAETTPSSPAEIDSYIAQTFPELAEPVTLQVVSPKRTLWEKAFILHEENARGGPSKPRLARHYYDLDALIGRDLYDESLFDPIKRQRAVNYGYSWIDYEHLELSDMSILPPDDHSYQAWARDYALMKPMLFGEVEEFSSIMQRLRNFAEQRFKK